MKKKSFVCIFHYKITIPRGIIMVLAHNIERCIDYLILSKNTIDTWDELFFIGRSESMMHPWIQWWIRISRPEMTMFLHDLLKRWLDLWSGTCLLKWSEEIWVISIDLIHYEKLIFTDLYASLFWWRRVYTWLCLKKGTYGSQGFLKLIAEVLCLLLLFLCCMSMKSSCRSGLIECFICC